MHSCTRAHTSVQLSLYCSLHQRYILIPSHQQFNTRTSKRRQERASSSFWSHEHYETTVAVINQPLMNLAIIKLSFTLLFLILVFLLVVCFSWPLYPMCRYIVAKAQINGGLRWNVKILMNRSILPPIAKFTWIWQVVVGC